MSVYFGLAGGYVKIGYSADPTARIATVTTNGTRPSDLPRGADVDLIGWVPGDREVEAAWHRRFAADHVAGEWFYIDPDAVRELIWDDPRGVDIDRMSAVAVFVAMAHPDMTRDEMARAGVRVDGFPEAEAVKHVMTTLCLARYRHNTGITCGKDPGHLTIDPFHQFVPENPETLAWLDYDSVKPAAVAS